MSGSLYAQTTKVVIPHWGANGDQQNTYFYKLLQLAFAETEALYGPVDLQIYPEDLSSARLMADLKQGVTVDVVWNGTSEQREKDFLPVYVSLLKELNEYRVLLVRKDDQEKFAQIQSLDELRKLTAGSGADWPSRDVLNRNGLPVVAVNNGNLLYPMLKAKRFDYISRNMFEAWNEENLYAKDGLIVEKTLLLHGGVPFYFFVNRHNGRLAERIKLGLDMAIADGRFAKLFFSFPDFKRGIDEIKLSKRKALSLEN
ncbi:MAG TPA: hypothetical protein VN030_03880 [Cellvibrio sp.]|nr:hypothetical protein [Cellvibrio sp.]